MDFTKINEAARGYRADMTRFLRDLVAIPGESCGEKGHILRIKEEMEKVGFDEVVIDPMGNVLGYMGAGETLIGFDAHIDTVGVGNRDNWNFDPYEGYENDLEIGGRGTSDQMGGIVSAVYGAKIMKDLGLLNDKYRVLVTGTVQEEDCDGLCWEYIVKEDHVRPAFVVSTEPTDGGIYRGQRGRMEIRIDVKGVSCHGSAPERGDNAIYKMADILQDVRALNENDAAAGTEIKGLVKMLDEAYNSEWKEARFLGRGTVTVSEIFFTSPSRCAVADSCAVSLDRRMTAGETWESCLEDIRNLPQGHQSDGGGLQGPLRRQPRGRARQRGDAQGPPADRQVDLLDQRRVDHGPQRHPLHRVRPGRGGAGARPQRDDLEGRSRPLRGGLRGASHLLL